MAASPNGRVRAESHAFTVVGGAASAHTLTPLAPGVAPRASSLAVLSIRPDGAQLSFASLLVVMSAETARLVTPALLRLADQAPTPPAPPLSALLLVRGGEISAECVWAGHEPMYNATLYRLLCHAAGWHAAHAMRASRLRLELRLATPAFTAAASFASEATVRLPPPAAVSGCLDLQYFEFLPRRDFDEWALAAQLAGVARVYVPDQLAYRGHVATQEARGFAVRTHDLAHRYVTEGGRAAPHRPSYAMKMRSDGGSNYICLHEHWYDAWVAVAWTPDEYLVFEAAAVPPAPAPLVAAAIRAAARAAAPRAWEYCRPEVCVPRPFYGPAERAAGDVDRWTLPNDGMKAQLGTSAALAMERYTRRYAALPPRGSMLKCFVHPDWRLGIMHVKLHSSHLRACPPRLRAACKLGGAAAWREVCRGFCGLWRNETCDECVAPPAPGCGAASTLAPATLITKSFELAHFRIPPPENRLKGYTVTKWLPAVGAVVRQLMGADAPTAA
ncbi:hypothetical protein AB1Y20_002634 [Prymnesium parvum]|uniref:Uncharacterized protein n=1 Tax=Prymnesium parvum TaxID=97485 RepID=A0AB34JBE2_PRYPA